MELSIGHTVGDRYRLEERLGSGAMGTVYRARHGKLAREFAVKVLHPPLTANAKLRRRFQREAEIASTLRHRNVVGVVDIGETDHLVYLVMELAAGVTLSSIMMEAPLPPARVIEYARQLCEGLQHAHDAGLIHRDFKPENVIVERDKAGNHTLRIIDFGIAMLRDGLQDPLHPGSDRERLTTEGIVLGTPHYMAPEHASGEDVDHRIDLFALGVICFEMLTGKMPFDGDGVDVARANIMYDTPAMATRVPYLNVDPLLEAFTRKLMAREKTRRFASAKAAREVLDLIEKDRPAAAIALDLDVRAVTSTLPPPIARNVLAIPVQRTRSAPTTLEPGATATLPAEPELPYETSAMPPVRKNRSVWIASGIAVLVIGVVTAVGMTRTDESQQIAEAPTVEPTPVAAKIAPAIAHEAPIQAPDLIEERPPPPVKIAPATPKPRAIPKPAITAPAPKPNPETPAIAPSATEVAQLYGSVGRALGHLQQAKGSDATIDLWPRFRHIRINDGIATPAARSETRRILEELKRDVDKRR